MNLKEKNKFKSVTAFYAFISNCKVTKYNLVDDYEIFFVANDKYNMYPTIAENSGTQIVNQYKRLILNRTEKDKGAYSEIKNKFVV